MANSDKNILITPNTGSTTLNPTIKFTGANNTPLTLRTLDTGTVSFEGTAGQLFSISDGLTGTIFSVNDISGIPSIEVLDTGLVRLNQYNGQTVIGGASAVSTAELTVYPSAAASLGLVVKGFASQTGNLQEWQNSAGTVLASINSLGVLASNGTIQVVGVQSFNGVGSYTIMNYDTGGAVTFTNGAANKGLIVRGTASQTANLQEWQDSTGAVTSYVGPFGSIGTANGNILLNSNGRAAFTLTNSTSIGLVMKGAASHTGDLTQFLNSSNTVLFGINSAGQQYFGATQTLGSQTFGLTAATASSTTVATFTHAQTGNLSVGQKVTIAGVTPSYFNGTWTVTTTSGSFTFTVLGSGFTASGTATGFGTFKSSAQLSILTPNSLTHPLVIQTAASQVANILEVISSTGTRIASIGPTGNGQFTGSVTVGSGSFIGTTLQEANQSASSITMTTLSGNTINTGAVRIRPRGSGGMPLIVQGANTIGTITAATANGTTITYTSNVSVFIVAGQSVTITDIVSTGNPGATAGSGFNLTNATVATASGSQFTVTNSLVDTYTSGGALTVTHSADLTQWQNNAGSILARVNSSGNITAASYITTGGTSSEFLKANGSVDSSTYLTTGTASSTYAPLASPTFTGTPLSTTATAGTNTTQIATTEFVSTAVSNLVDAAPGTLDTLNELAAALGDDASFATTVTNSIATKAPIASPTFTGTVTIPAGSAITGVPYLASANTFTASPQQININNAANKGLIVQGAAAQTANLQEWQDSSGIILSAIDKAGNLTKGDGDQLVLAGQVFG